MKLQKIISLNPSQNYEPIGEINCSTHHEIATKVAKARAAQSVWSSFTVTERLPFLERLYQEFVRRKSDIRSVIVQEIGMPVTLCDQIDIDPGLTYMRGYLDNAELWLAPEIPYESSHEIHYLFFEPKGVAGVSVPWNYPFQILSGP